MHCLKLPEIMLSASERTCAMYRPFHLHVIGCAGLQVMKLPISFLVRFWVNHHLLDLLQRPVWRVVSGRSRQYVDKFVAGTLLLCGAKSLHVCECGPLASIQSQSQLEPGLKTRLGAVWQAVMFSELWWNQPDLGHAAQVCQTC